MVDVGPVLQPGEELLASTGWCAPSNMYLDLFDPAGLRHWPAGLLPEDREWLARMLHAAEIDPEPYQLTPLDFMPPMSVRRGGITFPAPERGNDGPDHARE